MAPIIDHDTPQSVEELTHRCRPSVVTIYEKAPLFPSHWKGPIPPAHPRSAGDPDTARIASEPVLASFGDAPAGGHRIVHAYRKRTPLEPPNCVGRSRRSWGVLTLQGGQFGVPLIVRVWRRTSTTVSSPVTQQPIPLRAGPVVTVVTATATTGAPVSFVRSRRL